MSTTISDVKAQQYRPSRRSWIKLWVSEWLTGTVRWQLSPQQRAIWADLLALAGTSRFPGVVCSGETNGQLEPYPMDYLCSVFRCEDHDVRDALHLFETQARIAIDERGVIRITNWDKYQSEYQQKRQRTRYEKSTVSPTNVRPKKEKESRSRKDGDTEKKDSAPDGAPPAYAGARLTVSSKQDLTLGEAFPWVDRQAEYRKMNSWLEANPRKRPKRVGQFLHNWLSKVEVPNAGRKTGKEISEQRIRENLSTLGLVPKGD